MNPIHLTHIIYTSTAATEFDPAALDGILQRARRTNAERSVTGMLLYTAGSFFQVLEGEEATLAEMFARIAADPRHRGVTKIIEEPIAQRAFGDWTMGYLEVTSSDLESIEGFSDFFQQGNSLVDLPPGRAKKLLTAFAQGRWRAQLKGSGE